MAMEPTEFAFPMDAEECEEGYDREYVADDFARYFRAFLTSGIIADGGNIAESLQVVANDDMTTTLKAGNLIIDGYRYELMKDMVFQHRAADGVLDRIDRISITLDTAEREIHAILREGEYSYKPVAPQCRRSSEYMDYVVADVRIVKGAIKITQANITDTRLSTELCGIAFPFWKLDTGPFFAQLNSFYNEFVLKSDRSYDEFLAWAKEKKAEIATWQGKEEAETDAWQKKQTDDFKQWADNFILLYEGWMSGKLADWTDEIQNWFQNLREQLTDNAQVHLQEQIGNLNNLATKEKENLVGAINEVNGHAKDAVQKTGDTMTGTLNSSKSSGSYLAGNQGQAIINSTAASGAYTMLDKLNSTNGYFTDGVYQNKRLLQYTAKSTADAGTNAVTKSATLLDEAGNSNFPGDLTAKSLLGNASKVTNVFSNYGSRTLPTSGEALDITLGKIRKYLSDLGAAAFSSVTPTNNYDDLLNKPFHSNFLIKHDAYDAAYEETIESSNQNAVLVYGMGGASTASSKGASDFFRAYLITQGWSKDSFLDPNLGVRGKAMVIQLGSVGSVARWSIASTSNVVLAGNKNLILDFKITKGSYAVVQGIRIPMYTQYANNK